MGNDEAVIELGQARTILTNARYFTLPE